MIYLDNAATTYPKPEEVYQKIDWANRNIAINAGRGSYKAAQEASRLIEETRRQLIELVHGLGNEHAVLLPSATIALNVILNGLSFSDGDVIYVSPYEHNAVSANKSVSKISFSTCYDVNGKKFHHDFQWKFDAANSWDKNFGELCLQDFCKDKEGIYIPVSEINKINSLIFSKSEEEFFDRLKESDISFDFNLADYIDRKIPTDEKVISARFDEVGKAFTEFAYAIANEGFYTCLAKDCSEISKLCSAYANLGKYLRERTFPENLKWTLDAYINSFNIIGDISVFEAEKEIESCIVPAWHPATLEKINDQKIFFLDGCGEWWNEAQEKEKITEKEISDTLSDLLQMSMLQSTLDLFPSYGQVYFGTIASYGAFSLYGRNDIKNENRLRDMIHKDAIFDDDFDKNEVARLNDNAIDSDGQAIVHFLHENR